MDEHVIGIDFGTDSVRSVIVNARTGFEAAAAVFEFPRWGSGLYCDPRSNRFRQHPLDHVESLEATVRGALSECGGDVAASIRGISVDTTGSTPGPVDARGVPLALTPGFEEDPDAMFIVWKDHTAVSEADEINHSAREWGGTDYTRFSGGYYSAEWFWSKILHTTRTNDRVRGAASSWMEHCDWVPFLLAGGDDVRAARRSRCAAGHKAMWNASFGGLPSEEFLVAVDPLLEGLRARLYEDTWTSDNAAGRLSDGWAERLGLPRGIPVGVGAIDAHFGAVGAGIEPFVLAKVTGTSTCDMVVAPPEAMEGRLVRGICGQVDGSIIPGMVGMEAGQSAFGDVYAWFAELLRWAMPAEAGADPGEIIERLSAEASGRSATASRVLALDWLNGRRTPDMDLSLEGALAGLSLGTDAPDIFRALVDATAFGSKRIAERYVEEGIPIREVIALGGISRKAPLVMQTLADVMGVPVKVAAPEQACALGAAMFASVVGGVHPDIQAAQAAMGRGFDRVFTPEPERSAFYEERYRDYLRLGSCVESLARDRHNGSRTTGG